MTIFVTYKIGGDRKRGLFHAINRVVYKSISLKHYNVFRLALDRKIIHNALFPETALTVIEFARDCSGFFVVVVSQPYIIGDSITEQDRLSFLYKLGFTDAVMDYGIHLNYKVGDLNVHTLDCGDV